MVEDPFYSGKEVEETPKICSICGDQYDGWGNNALPINDGRCCNECNATKVIAARLLVMMSQR